MIQGWLQPEAPQGHPREAPGWPTPGLDPRPRAESPRPQTDAAFARGAGGLAPSGHPEGRDFYPEDGRAGTGPPHTGWSRERPEAAPSSLHLPRAHCFPSSPGRKVPGRSGHRELRPRRRRTRPPRSRRKFGDGPHRATRPRRAPRATRARGPPGWRGTSHLGNVGWTRR